MVDLVKYLFRLSAGCKAPLVSDGFICFLSLALVVAVTDEGSQCHVNAACEEKEVDGDEQAQDSDKDIATNVSRFRVLNEVAEAHDHIKDAQCGHFVEDLHVVGKTGIKWPEPSQNDN